MTTKPPGARSDEERVALIEWAARLGAVTATALATSEGTSLASARGRLLAAERRGELQRSRPLADAPALFTVTRAARRATAWRAGAPVSITPGNAAHASACAGVAAALEVAYPVYAVLGEASVRLLEGQRAGEAAPGALAAVAGSLRALPLPHRPDLLIVPPASPHLAVAVEVELTAKAPDRLAAICRDWARCRALAGVVYAAPAPVERALRRAIDRAQAQRRVAVVAIDALLRPVA